MQQKEGRCESTAARCACSFATQVGGVRFRSPPPYENVRLRALDCIRRVVVSGANPTLLLYAGQWPQLTFASAALKVSLGRMMAVTFLRSGR
jgi:hypothetical protein